MKVTFYLIGVLFILALLGQIELALMWIAVGVLAIAIICIIYKALTMSPESVQELEAEIRTAEADKAYAILMEQLLDIYSSLSWKYEKITTFCDNYPELTERLKKSEYYTMWRTEVINWANYNLDRIDFFYLDDGIVNVTYDKSKDYDGIVDIYHNKAELQDMAYMVDVDIEFNNTQLPEDYFEYPNLVWEDEDIAEFDMLHPDNQIWDEGSGQWVDEIVVYVDKNEEIDPVENYEKMHPRDQRWDDSQKRWVEDWP